jgi:hypothetical protein
MGLKKGEKARKMRNGEILTLCCSGQQRFHKHFGSGKHSVAMGILIDWDIGLTCN